MTSCPFCSGVLLRHIRAGQTYWFCRRCRTELSGNNCHPAIDLTASREPSNEDLVSSSSPSHSSIQTN